MYNSTLPRPEEAVPSATAPQLCRPWKLSCSHCVLPHEGTGQAPSSLSPCQHGKVLDGKSDAPMQSFVQPLMCGVTSGYIAFSFLGHRFLHQQKEGNNSLLVSL